MFTAIATTTGWDVYSKDEQGVIAVFSRLSTVKQMVENLGGILTIIINGYEVN